MSDLHSQLYDCAVGLQPLNILCLQSKLLERVGVRQPDRGLPPINQLLPLILVCDIELLLMTQPKLKRRQKLQSPKVVEYGIAHTVEWLIQAEQATVVSMLA